MREAPRSTGKADMVLVDGGEGDDSCLLCHLEESRDRQLVCCDLEQQDPGEDPENLLGAYSIMASGRRRWLGVYTRRNYKEERVLIGRANGGSSKRAGVGGATESPLKCYRHYDTGPSGGWSSWSTTSHKPPRIG